MTTETNPGAAPSADGGTSSPSSLETVSERIRTWGYVVGVQRVDGEEVWAIHEAYYDDIDRPVAWTSDDAAPVGDDLYELADDLHRMEVAVRRAAALEHHSVWDLDLKVWR